MTAADAIAVLEKRRSDVAEKLKDQLSYITHLKKMVPEAEDGRTKLELELAAIDRAQDALRVHPDRPLAIVPPYAGSAS